LTTTSRPSAPSTSAFGTDAEADLVDRVRAAGRPRVSLVAEAEGQVVGHILFTPARVESMQGEVQCEGLALAPLAVSPAHQGRGIGSGLTRAGLDACRRQGAPFVIVLGHPTYYPRFGFRRANDLGIGNEFDANDAFMILELEPGRLPRERGIAKYAPEFAWLAHSREPGR
jgi:putative acetyltransferase